MRICVSAHDAEGFIHDLVVESTDDGLVAVYKDNRSKSLGMKFTAATRTALLKFLETLIESPSLRNVLIALCNNAAVGHRDEVSSDLVRVAVPSVTASHPPTHEVLSGLNVPLH